MDWYILFPLVKFNRIQIQLGLTLFELNIFTVYISFILSQYKLIHIDLNSLFTCNSTIDVVESTNTLPYFVLWLEDTYCTNYDFKKYLIQIYSYCRLLFCSKSNSGRNFICCLQIRWLQLMFAKIEQLITESWHVSYY